MNRTQRYEIAVITLTLGLCPLALASASPSGVQNVRIALPNPQAPEGYGAEELRKGVEQALRPQIRPILDRQLMAAQKALKLTGPKAQTMRAQLQVATQVQANYLIHSTIELKGFLYRGRVRLVRVADQSVILDLNSQFYKPQKEAFDRGQQFGRAILDILKRETAGSDPSAPTARKAKKNKAKPSLPSSTAKQSKPSDTKNKRAAANAKRKKVAANAKRKKVAANAKRKKVATNTPRKKVAANAKRKRVLSYELQPTLKPLGVFVHA